MAEQPTHVRFINLPALFSPPGFTHVVEVTGGRTVYISGQIAVDQSFRVVGIEAIVSLPEETNTIEQVHV